MRHARLNQRLSRPSEARKALLDGLLRNLITRGQIQTTHAKAKAAQRLADRLVTLGKDGSIHARRRAFRVLQDRSLVRRLFVDIAPRFIDVRGGYTRVLRLGTRLGDGAERSLLAFSRMPIEDPVPSVAKPSTGPSPAPTPAPVSTPDVPKEGKTKKLFEGLRSLWTRKKKGSAAS